MVAHMRPAPVTDPDARHCYRISERLPSGRIFAYEAYSTSAQLARAWATDNGAEVVSVSHAKACPCRQAVPQ